MRKFIIKIVRESGTDEAGGKWMPYGEEHLTIEAENEDKAFRLSQVRATLRFYGQVRRTFIDGKEYFDPTC